MAQIALQGTPCHTCGELPAVGAAAPEFKLVTADLEDVGLADYRGKKKLLNIMPSLDTGVCASSARKFNESFAGRDDAVALVISADLPFAAARFCSTEGLSNVATLSLMRSKKFAKDYGVLIEDGPLAGLCARAVVVLGADDRVLHTELVPEITQEPDYVAALNALA